MSKRSNTDGETEPWTSRLRPDNLGQACRALSIASAVSFGLSMIGIVLYLLLLPEENPTVTIADPPVATLAGSWVGMVIALFGYSIWSAWQLRGLSQEQDLYEERRRWALWAFVLGVFALLVPVAMVHGSPGRAG